MQFTCSKHITFISNDSFSIFIHYTVLHKNVLLKSNFKDIYMYTEISMGNRVKSFWRVYVNFISRMHTN
jgi:hypothetical protein